MPPKKKGGKKQADDWENDLGETVDPIAQATEDAKQADNDKDAEDGEMNGSSGGLLAALRKNKDKRAKRGKPVQNDFVDGEDADGTSTPVPADLDAKAPTEATFDDEEDVFAGGNKKDKGGKKQPDKSAAAKDDDEDAGGGLKSKKEKEKEKKEREKQRKKEQVCCLDHPTFSSTCNKALGSQEETCCSSSRPSCES
jgi:translation initiation factor 5B